MSPRLEFEGKDVEKASQKACEELKIPKEKLKYDVISYGATGIFGLVGIKKAKIRVTLPDLTPEDNTEERDFEHNNKSKKHVTEVERSTEQARLDDKAIASIPDESVNLGKNVLQQIIDLITIDAEISFEKKSDQILFYIKGGNAAILIGKQGQTLEAMQYLVEKIVNKHSEQRIRIQIDIEGYLEKRQNNLKRLAGRLAEKAKRSGKPITIGQMNAHDRRIVHLALRDDSGIRTQSVGDGFLKKLLIFPKKKYHGKRKT
ncbi:MAG: Jag N-terminal domain-containing protein [Deltaproteobacteria bacterium]|jgi:spoIIIJ-associated protein|nr:Jag N-terminal domain-containing protein [Deltaproteobacteria bacterium]MDL1989083.1 Jag N-terminal domain-containing protein [Deltaproteobacteria bacterium]